MNAVTCPNCAAGTTRIAGKPYCPHCAWNIKAAEDAVRLRANVDLILVLLFAGLLAYGAFVRRGNLPLEIAATAVLLGIIPLYYFMRTLPLGRLAKLRTELSIAPVADRPWFKLEVHREVHRSENEPIGGALPTGKRLEFHVRMVRPQISIATETPTTTETATAQKTLAEQRLQQLRSLPRPRRARLTRCGMLYGLLGQPALAALACLCGYAAWKGVASARSIGGLSQQDWVFIIATFVVAGALAQVLRKIVLDRSLLREGAITLGRVVRQDTGRYETSTITYSFSDISSRAFSKIGTDYSKEYYEGMWVLIFYDSSDPRRNVADGCALYALDQNE
jgi:hypothetical protein